MKSMLWISILVLAGISGLVVWWVRKKQQAIARNQHPQRQRIPPPAETDLRDVVPHQVSGPDQFTDKLDTAVQKFFG